MITYSELKAVELSPTKKDFYQIWNELLEIAGKISERWDPSATNESDPGIILLKVLTAVADKLNYTIDSNILEAFMPSAAQEESMKKLCDMLGYTMKYYRSATTNVKITYKTTNNAALPGTIIIDRFTNLKDVDGIINYITLNEVTMNQGETSKIVECLEGELLECETDDNNIVSMIQIDDNKRYYFPESHIAENGIFITNIIDGAESEDWRRVDNLNTQNIKERVFKFGFDSKLNLPYVQFPEDISTIIEDGLKIRYVRTKGSNGNISVKTLCKMEPPLSWSVQTNTSSASEDTPDYYLTDNYEISNISAATNGADKESMTSAYENYKKTIGTFDTLVTCRDYMNKIYQMTATDASSTNLVSNVIVSDIRDDINKAFTLCTFTDRGIEYKNMSREVSKAAAIPISKATYENLNKIIAPVDPTIEGNYSTVGYWTTNDIGKLFMVTENGVGNSNDKIYHYARCIYNGNYVECPKIKDTALSHFDLVIYPFKNVYGLNSKSEYQKSFKYDTANLLEITQNLEESKTLAHTFVEPASDDIVCIKNYLRLDAKVTTVNKVSPIEVADIEGKIYSKVYESFNLRNIDFGEELPYETILSVLESADPRIKSVSLEDPTVVTRYCTASGAEYQTSTGLAESDITALHKAGDRYFNQLVLNNVLAGKLPLFNYNTSFEPSLTESEYPSWVTAGGTPEESKYNILYPATPVDSTATVFGNDAIYALETEFLIDGTVTVPQGNANPVKDIRLTAGEVIQFRMPNLKTTRTYPAYVNYYAKLNVSNNANYLAIPATMQSITSFLNSGSNNETTITKSWEHWAANGLPLEEITFTDAEAFNKALVENKAFFKNVAAAGATPDYRYTKTYVTKASTTSYSNAPTYNSTEGAWYVGATKITAAAYTPEGEELITLPSADATTTINSDNSWVIGDLVTGIIATAEQIYDEDQKYYRVKLERDPADGVVAFGTWLSTLSEFFPYQWDGESETRISGKINGLYIANGIDTKKPLGQLIDINYQKYKEVTQPKYISTNPLDTYLVPILWSSTVIPENSDARDTATVAQYHTADGLGRNHQNVGIKANEDYQLKEGEYIYFNWTQSSNDTGTEVKTQENKACVPGDIIRPNFELVSSELKSAQNQKFTKTDGFNFSEFTGGNTIKGLYTLGPNEQIEIRDFIEVELDEMSTLIYWELNNEEALKDNHNRIIFKFDEEYVDKTSGNPVVKPTAETPNSNAVATAYTLKEGEFFCYTDYNKTDLAYFGAGTRIKRSLYTPEIFKYHTDSAVSAEEISARGMSAAISWRPFDFSASGGRVKKLTLTEFQYINLIEGNILNYVSTSPSAKEKSFSPNGIDNIDITNEFKPITAAGYTINTTQATLPNVNFDGVNGWEIRSKLELNVGPSSTQTLKTTPYTQDSIKVLGRNRYTMQDSSIVTLKALEGIPLSIKTNKSLIGHTRIDATTKEYSSYTGEFLRSIPDLQIKVFSDSPITDFENSSLNLSNFGNDGYTKMDFLKVRNKDVSAVTLNAVIPNNHFGLLAMYYLKSNSQDNNTVKEFETTTTNTTAGIRLFKTDNSLTSGTPVCMNNINNASQESWWNNLEGNTTLNPNGTGGVVNTSMWAAEASPFTTLTKNAFDVYKTSEKLYKRHLLGYADINGKFTKNDIKNEDNEYRYENLVYNESHTTSAPVGDKDSICIYHNPVAVQYGRIESENVNNAALIVGEEVLAEDESISGYRLKIGLATGEAANPYTWYYLTTTTVGNYISLSQVAEDAVEDAALDSIAIFTYNGNLKTLNTTINDENYYLGLEETGTTKRLGLYPITKLITIKAARLYVTESETISPETTPSDSIDSNLFYVLGLTVSAANGSYDTHLYTGELETNNQIYLRDIIKYCQKTDQADAAKKHNFYYRIEPNGDTYNLFGYTIVETDDSYDSTADYGNLLNGSALSAPLYCLREGLNIIKIDNSYKLQVFAGCASTDVIIFSPLSVIPSQNALNPKLNYKSITKNGNTYISPYEQILEDIRAIDSNLNFLYNAPIPNATGIDLNDLDEIDTMEHYSNWYDKNNVNNKFVVSQIDADYMVDHVRISRASRR